MRHLAILFLLFGSMNLFAYQIVDPGEGRVGCDAWTVEICIVDECGNPLILPYEVVSQLGVVLNSSLSISAQVSQQDENGCVTLTYYPPPGSYVGHIRIVWRFQQNGCPSTHIPCTPEEVTFGIDHVLITTPRCNENTTMTLSNYTRRNQFYLRTEDCERTALNRVNHTIEVCSDDPTLFFEVSDPFTSNYSGNNYAVEFEIVDNNNLDDAGNPTVVASEFVRCPVGRLQASLLFTTKDFVCGVDEEGNPIIERVGGIDIANYLGLSADPTCEEPSSITLNINLYCCSEDGPSDEPFVNLSYTFIWQPDVQVPDPLFYFITENNVIEAMNDNTPYDNGISGDDLLINADSDPESYTGDGPTLGTLTAGLGFDGSIQNPDCVQKYEIELYEFPNCGLADWGEAVPITVDHDQDPATPEISRFDITSEVTSNGYDALFMTLAVDPVFGESLFQLSKNTCYYAKVIMTTQCEVIERFGRFETANCNFCREVVEQDEREIRIFPTIVEHELTIGSNVDYPETVDINIYDASGRTALQTKHQNQGRFLNVNTSSLQPGLHFIEIIMGDEKEVHKILVQ